MINMAKESISIKIKPDIWKQAKIQAIEEDITSSELVEKALKEKLKKGESMCETYHPNICKYCGNDTFKICTEVPQDAVQAVDQINMIQCAKCGREIDE